MELSGILRATGPNLSPKTSTGFAAAWKTSFVPKGTYLTTQDDPSGHEYFILDGRALSEIADRHGRAICVGFHAGPGIVTPHVARTRAGISTVSTYVTTDATIAKLDAETLMTMMVQSEEIREWANTVLRDELARKTGREWCLAALGGAERLRWFRNQYPDHEALFAHGSVASFLGMTPVTLSRLRHPT